MNDNEEIQAYFRQSTLHFSDYYINTFLQEHHRDFTAVSVEESNISKAILTAAENNVKTSLMKGVNLFYPFLESRGLYKQAQEQLIKAITVERNVNDSWNSAKLYHNLGRIAFRQENNEQAKVYWHQCLEQTEEQGFGDITVSVLSDLGTLAIFQERYLDAESYLQKAVPLAYLTENPDTLVKALGTFGMVQSYFHELDKAESLYQQALKIAKEYEMSEEIARLYTNLGVLANSQDNNDKSISYYQKALEIARSLGILEGINVLLINLAERMLDKGEYAQAEAYINEGLEIAHQLNNTRRICVLLMNQGLLEGKRGDIAKAEQNLQRSLKLANEKIESTVFNARIFIELGKLYEDIENWSLAQHYYSECLKLELSENDKIYQEAASEGIKRVLKYS